MDDATVRERLKSMLTDLDRSIGVLQGNPATRAERSAADGGADLTDTDRVQAMLSATTIQRRAILSALTRLDEGVYGRCVDCGRQVPEGRLEARPEAACCVQCQSKRERRR